MPPSESQTLFCWAHTVDNTPERFKEKTIPFVTHKRASDKQQTKRRFRFIADVHMER